MGFLNQLADASMGKDHIPGIYCDVERCAYHDPRRKCTARMVNVGPSFAGSSQETVCSTFKPRENQ